MPEVVERSGAGVLLAIAALLLQSGCHLQHMARESQHPGRDEEPGSQRDPAVWTQDPESAEEGERLVEQAIRALESVETGTPAEAAREIDRLAELFPGNRSAELFQAFLRRKLLRVDVPAVPEKPPPLHDPELALRELEQARALIKGRRNEEARAALERARMLDPTNLEIADALVSLLKQLGLDCYTRGSSVQAIMHWQRVLEILPGEPEAIRFLQRASAVLKKI